MLTEAREILERAPIRYVLLPLHPSTDDSIQFGYAAMIQDIPQLDGSWAAACADTSFIDHTARETHRTKPAPDQQSIIKCRYP